MIGTWRNGTDGPYLVLLKQQAANNQLKADFCTTYFEAERQLTKYLTTQNVFN